VLRAEATTREHALHDIGAQLYQFLLGYTQFDVGPHLDDRAIEYLVLRLDESNAYLPWELLCRPGGFLSCTHVMSRQLEIHTPGRSAALRLARDRLRVLVIGNPTGDLPAAEKESRAVAALLDGLDGAEVEALIGTEDHPVTYEAVSTMLGSQPYDVLHYAGHADFSPGRRGKGGFRLAGEALLTPTDLSTRRYLPALVFANACNSAALDDSSPASMFGSAEATRDLVKGLLEAGVQAFIGSLWPVDDAAAATFAQASYNALVGTDDPAIRRRQTVGQAVRAAREAVIGQHSAAEPTWAAYALYGSPWALGL
jgi:CHAT domain-containing protein